MAILIYNLAVCKRTECEQLLKSETQPVAESSFRFKATVSYEAQGIDMDISALVPTDALFNRFNMVVICSGGGRTGRM